MRLRKAAHVLLPLLVVIFGVVMTAALWSRSAIPASMDGVVRSIDVRDEHPGVGNAWFVRVGDDTHYLDRRIGEQLHRGDRVTKDRWDREVTVNGKPIELHPSPEAKAALWFAPVLALGAAAVSFASRPRVQPATPRQTPR